ncbi:hypothetical protein QBC44DRAFT_161066 [Cladorrhinum sp. PSN332]|nr:hypothetical protein QBC44DRAFT_161066 [Cladorrhinum sp. PSN332]
MVTCVCLHRGKATVPLSLSLSLSLYQYLCGWGWLLMLHLLGRGLLVLLCYEMEEQEKKLISLSCKGITSESFVAVRFGVPFWVDCIAYSIQYEEGG